MNLTSAQRSAGRAFRDACQAELDELNAAEPPGAGGHPLLRVIRHPCKERGGASVGIELREHYQLSPLTFVPNPPGDPAPGEFVPEGLFCWIWKDGRCPDCKLVLRSTSGLIDLAADHPPERKHASA